MKRISSIFVVFVLTCALTFFVKAQAPEENMATFFDSDIPEIRVQVNATMETQPLGNITVTLSLKNQSDVQIQYLNLSMFGFINGTYKVLMANLTDNNVSLNTSSLEYNYTFMVPEQVWDATYGEITLTYNVKYPVGPGFQMMPYDFKIGFTMTHVKNTYLEQVEQACVTLNSTLEELKQVFSQLSNEDLTADNLNKTLSNLQGSAGELDNTRRAVIGLTVTTAVFVATTVYMFLRKPKQYL